MNLNYTIEGMQPEDWEQVRAIYVEGIETENATFETTVPGWQEWDGSHHSACRLVARAEDEVLGWAALAAVSSRCIYQGVAEGSLYVRAGHQGQGVGTTLLQSLIRESEADGFWTLQAMVFPENVASLRILEKCGFTAVGRRKRIGVLNGVWRDVLLLERRSSRVGPG